MLKLATLVVLFFAVESLAVCCKRKANFGCCGNGGCNIFCCNCDNGCNTFCERKNCNFVQCVAVVTGCAGVCVFAGAFTGGAACVACLGPEYKNCEGCYIGSRRRNLMSILEDEPQSVLEQCKMDAMGKFETDILEEVEHLQDVFDCLVKESGSTSAKLDFNQTCAVLGCNSTTEALTKEVFDLTDANKDGFLTAEEFDDTLNAELMSDVAEASSSHSTVSLYTAIFATGLSVAAQIS